MTSCYVRDHKAGGKFADEFSDMLSSEAQAIIINAASFFEGQVDNDTTPTPSEGERLALKRAMARFVIDSGIASARGWV